MSEPEHENYCYYVKYPPACLWKEKSKHKLSLLYTVKTLHVITLLTFCINVVLFNSIAPNANPAPRTCFYFFHSIAPSTYAADMPRRWTSHQPRVRYL